jgi:hypothetical protein
MPQAKVDVSQGPLDKQSGREAADWERILGAIGSVFSLAAGE